MDSKIPEVSSLNVEVEAKHNRLPSLFTGEIWTREYLNQQFEPKCVCPCYLWFCPVFWSAMTQNLKYEKASNRTPCTVFNIVVSASAVSFRQFEKIIFVYFYSFPSVPQAL